MTDTTDTPPTKPWTPSGAEAGALEASARDTHGKIVEQLAKLRAQRETINKSIHTLVGEEETLRRIVAVFDRANGKSAP